MTDRPGARRRGCLSLVGVYVFAAALLVAVWALRPNGTGSPSPEPVPTPATGSPSYSRAPEVTFSPEVELVLARAWWATRHGCGITGPAVDDLAAALERDIGEAPPLDARIVASQWVSRHCAHG